MKYTIQKIPAFLVFTFSLLHLALQGQMRKVYVDAGNSSSRAITKLSFYTPSTGYIASTDPFQHWIGFTTDSGRTITKRTIRIDNVNYNGQSVNLTFGFYINGVKAFDQNNLIIYGDYGFVPAILYSTDGGLNYSLVYHFQFAFVPASSVEDMIFPQGNSIGYAVTADQVLKTIDGGHSWLPVKTDAGRNFKYIEAVDNNNLFAFTTNNVTGKMYKTTDGGTTWQEVITPAASTIFYSYFVTTSKGWLVMRDHDTQLGKVYYSSNGGNTWVLKNNMLITPFLCQKMKFINDSTGFAVGGFNTYKTTDSGRVWEPIPRNNNFSYLGYGYNDIQFINNNQFWSGGDIDFLEINTDPGTAPSPKAFFDIDTSGYVQTGGTKLVNYSKPSYSYKWYLNNQLIASAYNVTYTHDVYHPIDTIKLVVSNGVYSDSLEKYQNFGPIPTPSITSFSPLTGTTGSVITIYGNYLLKTTSVRFGNFPALSLNIISDTEVRATVGDGGSGYVRINTIGGADSLSGFTYIPPPPVITSVSPLAAIPGTVITITGNYFNSATAVSFGGTPAISFNVVSQTQIQAVVGATSSGNVLVTTSSGPGSFPGFSIMPTITFNSFSPVSAPVGATITIDGNNFSTTAANNIVYFGGVVATVANATSTQLTVQVPAGAAYHPIVVQVNNQSAESSLSFTPTFPNVDTLSASSFTPVVTYNAPSNYNGAGCLGDLNRDGKLDLVTGSLSIFRNTSSPGNISFGPRQDIFTNIGASTFLLRDMNGDGWLDLVVNSTGIKILKNISTGGNIIFDIPFNLLNTGNTNFGLSIADIDGDSRPDIAAPLMFGNKAIVARNTSSNGILSFENYLEYSTGDNPWGCVLTDLDGDRKPEMVIGNYYDHNVAVYHNISIPGKISFENPVIFTLTGATRAVSAGDMNGDGKTDIVITQLNNLSDSVIIMKNTSTGFGNFSFVNTNLSAVDPFSVQVADLNGDGMPDLETANQGNQTISLYQNTGNGTNITFASRVNLTTGGNVYPRNAPAGDLDNDGKPDIVYINYNLNSITIFRNGLSEHYADAGRDTTLCAAGPSVQIGTPAVAGYTYSWTSIPTGFTSTNPMPLVTPSVTTKYYLTVTIPSNFHSTDSTTVTIQNLQANAGNDINLCEGTGTAIGSNAQAGITYSWTSIPTGFTSNEATPLVFPPGTTQYCLLITSTAGCTSKDTVTLTIIPNSSASVSIAGTTTVAAGQSSLISTNTINGGNAPWYVWQDSTAGHGWQNIIASFTSTLNYSPQQTGDKLRCLMSTSKPCASPGTTTSNVLQFTVNIVTTIPICSNLDTTLLSDITGTSYQWQQNTGSGFVNISDNTNFSGTTSNTLHITKIPPAWNGYEYRCVVNGNQYSKTYKLNVLTSILPTISIAGTTNVSPGDNTLLSAAVTNQGNLPAYQWQDSTNTHDWQNISAANNAQLNYKPEKTGDKIRCILYTTTACASQNTTTSNALVFTVNILTGINNVPYSNFGIKYYPNPVSSIVYIDSLKLSDRWESLDVIGMDGRHVISYLNIVGKTKAEVNLARFSPGKYIIRLRKKTGERTLIKIIKI